jgi:hypothetical protein
VQSEEGGILQRKIMMWNFLAAQGKALVQMYIEALLHVPPREVADYYTETLVAICVAFREENVAL